MDRYVLLVVWNYRGDQGQGEEFSELTAIKRVYELLRKNASISSDSRLALFPACSISGGPTPQKWFFAIQAIHGFSQFCSPEWDEIGSSEKDRDCEEPLPVLIEECLNSINSYEEEDSDVKEPLSLSELFEEAAEGLHQLADKLPPPGKGLLDLILLVSDHGVPRLKDWLPVVGALKHLREWHSAEIIIAVKNSKCWQKISENLGATVVNPENFENMIDPLLIWRGDIHIKERKFASEVMFPGFCLKAGTQNIFNYLKSSNTSFEDASMTSRTTDAKGETFYYYKPVLEFVQLVALSDLPSYFRSGIEFEFSLSRTKAQGKSKQLLNQLSSLQGKVGALFNLSCTVSNTQIPPANQYSTRKWKDYVARKPKCINVPEIEMKGEVCSYYLMVQSNCRGGCKAILIHSANQINGAAAIAIVNGILEERLEDKEECDVAELLGAMPYLTEDQLVDREKKLAQVQTLALREFLKSRQISKMPLLIPINELKALLTLVREQYFGQYDRNLPSNILGNVCQRQEEAIKRTETDSSTLSPSQWPERSVLERYENLERTRQKSRVGSMLTSSSEILLGLKDSQRLLPVQLDAKELLKYFTPEGFPVAELQPLQIQRGENEFPLTPEMTLQKLKGLPFEKATECHYHGVEYCLDNSRALEKDIRFGKLQSRLIRYETNTTCSREQCPVIYGLSPLSSPAVLSEPGSVPDGEAFQNDQKNTGGTGQKHTSRKVESFQLSKRLSKSKSTESLNSQYSLRTSQEAGNNGNNSVAGLREHGQSLATVSASSKKPNSQIQRMATKACHESVKKESRSQKHKRMLKEVVAKVLESNGISKKHKSFLSCSQRLFKISMLYLKDLKTSRGLHEEMKKTANNNVRQVIDWVLEKTDVK
ncbi:mdm2-binding protein isoform X2 [Chiloscyllium plagiosum]|uniref:mdm2-binding protein isoform X2 n=1 Tax=Chiloscyllium plagiosum TaxID=36176 RepID=UPI001CB84A80|nr:mdm2-binding protein isoform X2 [Chiloscyllium plagiosum]